MKTEALPGAKCERVVVMPWARLVCKRPAGHVCACMFSVERVEKGAA